MNINATLLLQVAHFGIVYYALRLLVLKPAYALIKQERTTRHALQERISNAERAMEIMHEKRYQMWYANHQFFARVTSLMHKPSLHESVEKSRIITTHTVSQKDIESAALKFETLLVDKLKECK